MEFKYINDKNKTPKTKFSSTQLDNPFITLGNFSTPPSRFAKIYNPFESHQLIEQLHLPTFSPSVFATISTPKSEEKFKWTIEDISQLKPANIDENTISQHVFEEDPHIESIVQQKIDKFFSEKVIVPSPMTEVVRVPLVNTDMFDKAVNTPDPQTYPEEQSQNSVEAYTQTVLTLPPNLPPALENALKPYFTFTADQQNQQSTNIENTSLYKHLFTFENTVESPQDDLNTTNNSSIALSTGLSPIQFSPIPGPGKGSLSFDSDELKECPLSPILRGSTKDSRSVCRLDFSSLGMSIDTSMVVPDVNAQNNMTTQSLCLEENSSPPFELLSESDVNWDMEYKHVSLASPNLSSNSNKMDISHSTTPHSKIFTSQRKRLSDSFKDENKENIHSHEKTRQNRKLFKNDVTDAGYHTVSGTYEESCSSMHVFASTPSKRNQCNNF